jgi:DNA polymerase III epsilon subunit family exonuclease
VAARLSQTVSTRPYGDHVTIWEPIAPISAERIHPEPIRPEPIHPESIGPDSIPNPREPMHTGSDRPELVRPVLTGPGLIHPAPDLARTDFVIVDVETTGWLPEDAGITEIGAVRVARGRPSAEFSALVNPGRAIPADIVALTGITDAMVSQAPPVGAVLPGFLAFASGCVLTAHNAPFDIGFLTAACGHCQLDWPDFTVLDTASLARSVLGEDEVPDCKLATLASFFGAQTQPCHRALADARATADVLAGLLARLADRGVRTLAELSA